ncbi:MAG: hypothetical protein K6G80_10855 [Treponema sp.]|nr:hypothetical protein [Treponema sp.]
MEELRSTEILDKEIEADARKKAEKLLANADAECQQLLDGVSGRVQQAADEKKRYYEEKLASFSANLDASLPLEKERFLASFYAESVAGSLNDYLTALGEEKRLALVLTRLPAAKEALAGKNITAKVYGFACADVKKQLEKAFGKTVLSCTETSFELSGEECALLNNVHEGIILESEDRSVRCRLTTDQLVSELKDTYSAELATTLFGGRLPA